MAHKQPKDIIKAIKSLKARVNKQKLIDEQEIASLTPLDKLKFELEELIAIIKRIERDLKGQFKNNAQIESKLKLYLALKVKKEEEIKQYGNNL